MKYLNSLNRIVTSAESIKSVLPLNPIILFLINNNSRDILQIPKGSSYFFDFVACEDLNRTEPLIIGQYNGIFGCLDKTMDLNNFKPMHFLENGLSNQLSMYIVEELSLMSLSNDSMQNENMILALGDYLIKLFCEQKKLNDCLKMGITPFQLKNVYKYINEKIDQSISTGELAEIAGLSVHHFIRMFKRTTGETPHQCVIKFKLGQAKKLLLNTEDNITQVGLGVGFDNPSHFSQLFKSNCGISPLKFRKAYSNNRLTA